MRSRWLLLLVLPLAGCVMSSRATHRHGHGGGGDDDLAEAEEVRFGVDTPEGTPSRKRPKTEDGIVVDDEPPPPLEEDPPGDDGDGEGPDLFAGPHAKRPGATELEKERPRTVTFTAPDAKLQPLRRDRRPRLPDAATLSVAFVRDGELTFSAEAVLELEELLAKEPAIKLLASLGQPAGARVGLKELASQAHEDGWDLLLVDVRDGTANRLGYLLHAKSGVLLARYEVNGKGVTTPASTGATPDLPERLATSYARLTK